MSRRAALIAGVALLMSASLADAQPRRGRDGSAGPNPSAIVSAELAFARLAQEKGQWTAFRETADKDAIMFVPETVNAQTWLRKRADPAAAVKWQPYRVFVSCDGSYAASTGPWQKADGSQGSFTTIWRRQKKGDWKWLADFGSATVIPKSDDFAIEGKVADCPARGAMGRPRSEEAGKPDEVRIAIPPPASGTGQSPDGSLRWSWSNGAREQLFEVRMRYRGEEQSVIREAVALGGS